MVLVIVVIMASFADGFVRCHAESAVSTRVVEKPKKKKKKQPNVHTKDSLETVRKRLTAKKAVLIDVREKGEWDAGHLKAAKLVSLSQLRKNRGNAEFAKRLAKTLPKKKIIYCDCRSGGRVLLAAPILRKLGYDVRSLKAGYESLLKAGFKKAE